MPAGAKHAALAHPLTSPFTTERILVLLAAFNGKRWIAQQIDTILAQQGVEVHLLISDDASFDGTWELLEARHGGDARVSLVRSSTPSGTAGANFRRLFEVAQSTNYDHVALADQDDLWLPDKLARAVAALKMTNAEGYSSAVEAFWANGKRRTIAQSACQRAADFLFEGAGQGCTFVMTEKLFARVQAFCRDRAQLASALHYHDWAGISTAR
jgi:rhamnosyltransferase